jgi:hypothetical protein
MRKPPKEAPGFSRGEHVTALSVRQPWAWAMRVDAAEVTPHSAVA